MANMSSRLPRFSIRSVDVRGDEARIAGPELHHLRDVLRLKSGDQVRLFDEDGRNFTGRLKLLDTDAAVITIEGVEQSVCAPALILALAVIKGPRMDVAIEKAAELGASEVWPLICARSVVRDPGPERLARWRRLAAAACKQSLSPRQVEIKAPLKFTELTARLPKDYLAVMCQADATPLASVLRAAGGRGIVIACGPEGDFTSDEIAAAEHAGFLRASLGRNRLRTETAALAAIAIAASTLPELAPAQ